MGKKRILKLGLFIGLGLLFIAVSGFGLLYYQVQGKFDVDTEKYPHHIGYLSPENPDFSKDFKRCSDRLPIGFYHSTAPHIYKNGKPTFRKYVQERYNSEGFTDSGYLNLRFLIDCEGDLGDLEVNELDNDMQVIDLDDAMVEQLVGLTMQPENWANLERKEPRDLYMYIIFKLEHGKVVEILP